MLQRKINRGTPPPLFDRIIEDKNEWVGNQLLNEQELQQSIMNELSLILNTRCTVRKVVYQDHIQNIPLFGLPDFFGLGDFSYFDGANPQEWPGAALLIETAIKAAEPRLKDIRVTIENYNLIDGILSVTVSAFIKAPHLEKEIHFPLELQHHPQESRKKIA